MYFDNMTVTFYLQEIYRRKKVSQLQSIFELWASYGKGTPLLAKRSIHVTFECRTADLDLCDAALNLKMQRNTDTVARILIFYQLTGANQKSKVQNMQRRFYAERTKIQLKSKTLSKFANFFMRLSCYRSLKKYPKCCNHAFISHLKGHKPLKRL